VRRLVNRVPARGSAMLLGAMPFILLIFVYVFASNVRQAANSQDKLLPTPATLAETIGNYAFERDRRSGEILFWLDTWASLERLFLALLVSAAIGLTFGIALGVIPTVRATLAPFVAALSMVIGITPVIVRDLALRASELPAEQLIKAQTLGASTWQLIVRVVLPQTWPRLIDALRLTLGAAWLFLIAAEAIASTEGLGYRIFLVRRYLAMDVILPYVVWITVLAFLTDWLLKLIRSRACPWIEMGR
jgi:NitT/TauT family transport system permease protein